jgi:hypothetical protein
VKKIITIVFFVPMACRVFGTTSIGDRANISEDGWEYWNQDPSPVAIHSKWLSSDWGRIPSFSIDASTQTTSWAGTANGSPSAARIFQSQLSLKNFLNRRHTRQEVLRQYPGKMIL